MSGGIDYNRGTISRNTPSGIRVIEYEDEPGKYYSLAGKPVDGKTAKAAGFDTEKSRKRNRRTELYAEAQAKADAQVEREMESIAKSVDREMESITKRVEKEPAETEESPGSESADPVPAHMEKAGHGRWNVLDGEGKVVAEDVSRHQATRMVANLQGR